MPDRDGYPTDEELEKVKTWEMKPDCLPVYMEYIKSIWSYPDYVWREGPLYVMATGGWSGNEDIIGAMQQNTIFWLFYWESSERGGRYKFGDSRAIVDWEDGTDWLI